MYVSSSPKSTPRRPIPGLRFFFPTPPVIGGRRPGPDKGDTADAPQGCRFCVQKCWGMAPVVAEIESALASLLTSDFCGVFFGVWCPLFNHWHWCFFFECWGNWWFWWSEVETSMPSGSKLLRACRHGTKTAVSGSLRSAGDKSSQWFQNHLQNLDGLRMFEIFIMVGFEVGWYGYAQSQSFCCEEPTFGIFQELTPTSLEAMASSRNYPKMTVFRLVNHSLYVIQTIQLGGQMFQFWRLNLIISDHFPSSNPQVWS